MKKILKRVVALTAVLTFTVASSSFGAGGSIGYGDISVYKENKLVTKLSGQNPIEDGSLLDCDGKCMVKSEGISLIGQDAAKFAVAGEDDNFKILLKEGTIDYVINSNARKITFYTPQGSYTVAEAVFNAAGSSAIKGSIIVDEAGQTEISVTEGRLMVATADGVKAVDANNKIVLAQNPDEDPGLTKGEIVVLTVAGAGATGAIIYLANEDEDDPASPPR